jgi:hypothetical protein
MEAYSKFDQKTYVLILDSKKLFTNRTALHTYTHVHTYVRSVFTHLEPILRLYKLKLQRQLCSKLKHFF